MGTDVSSVLALIAVLLAVVVLVAMFVRFSRFAKNKHCYICGSEPIGHDTEGRPICLQHSTSAYVSPVGSDDETDDFYYGDDVQTAEGASEYPASDWECPEHPDETMVWVPVPVDGLDLEIQVCTEEDDVFLLEEDLDVIKEFIGLPADAAPEQVLANLIEAAKKSRSVFGEDAAQT